MKQVNATNVAKLTPIAIAQTGYTASFETTPLIVNGVMYITTPMVNSKQAVIALDATHLLERPEYQTSDARRKNRDALNAELERYTVKRSSADWVDAINTAGVPCGPIYKINEMFADPQVEHLGTARAVALQDGGEIMLLAQPFALSRTPSALAAPPPELGEHTDEVLGELGYTPEDIAALLDTGIVS